MERLQKFIAASGYTSRRKAEELIKEGKVYVNGEKVTTLGTKVTGNDDIIVEGVHLQKEEHIYYLLNKPRGIICSVKDEHDRKNSSRFNKNTKRIYPVGRLDYDTTGLIILTNDGELANILMHPKNNVPKKYVAKLNKSLAITDLKHLQDGVIVEGVKCKPTRVKIKKNDPIKDYSIVEITIVEGRNHIIKKVFMELGYLVDKLTRIEYGYLTIDGMKSGDYRELSIKEVKNYMTTNIKIISYDHETRGIGKIDGKIIFIPNTIIDEEVSVEITKEKKNYLEGKVIKYNKESSLRIKPKCPYYNNCGGCSFWHLNYEEELKIKEEKFKNILNKYAGIDKEINIIKPTKYEGYRNKIELKIKDNKWGYFNESSHNFIEINNCLLAKESINKVIINKELFNIKSGNIIIRSNYNDEIIIKIDSNDSIEIDTEKLQKKIKLIGIIHNDKIIYGEDNYVEYINGYYFKVNINSFFQINLEILSMIYNILNKDNYGNVIDLYCGVGTLGIPLKKNKLYGIEVVKEAIIDANINSKINKQDNIYMCIDASKMNLIKDNIDTIIVDPPRSGLNKETLNEILNKNVNKIIYMSCNPITLARDLNTIKEKYNLEKIYMADMFPRTKHVESVCILKRKQQL